MSDIQPTPESEEERKRRDRIAFEQYFTAQRQKESGRNRTAIIWVLLIGVGLPVLFYIVYFFVMIFLASSGKI